MEELIKQFYDKARIFSKSKTKVIVDGRTLNPAEFYAFCLDKYPFFEEYVKTSGIWKLSDKDKADWVTTLWREYFAYDRAESVYTSDAFDGTDLNTTDFELVIDYHTGKKVVFNNKARAISKMHPDAYMKALTSHQRKLILDQGTKLATFSFDPYNEFEKRLKDVEGNKVVEFNCHQPAPWRCDEHGRLDPSLEKRYDNSEPPKLFRDFITHLIPNEEHRRFVINWLHNAIFKRNETYLVLNGKKGAGKNLLADLIGKLVGEDYYRKTHDRFLDAGFNAVMDKARVLLLDELKIESHQHQNKLKSYINPKQNIERKGVDAEKPVETFNSYIINNNHISDMLLVWDDRRFSVPDLTEVKLRDAWGDKKIQEFVSKFNDIEWLRELGFWLKNFGRDPSISEFDWLAGERFWKIVYHSLTEWQKVVYDAIMSREKSEYSIAELKQMYKRRMDVNKFPFKAQKIGDFLDDFRLYATTRIGRLGGSGDSGFVIPADQFKPVNKKDEDDAMEAL